MSAKIDLEKRLTKDEVDYLISRDKWVELAYTARTHGTELPEATRKSLQARGYVLEADSATEDASESEEAGSGDVSGSGDAPEKFSDEWFDSATIAELQPELEKRGLPKSGKRAELADRLYADMDEKGELPDSEENV